MQTEKVAASLIVLAPSTLQAPKPIFPLIFRHDLPSGNDCVNVTRNGPIALHLARDRVFGSAQHPGQPLLGQAGRFQANLPGRVLHGADGYRLHRNSAIDQRHVYFSLATNQRHVYIYVTVILQGGAAARR